MSNVETITQDLETASDGEVPEHNLGAIRDRVEKAMTYSLSGLARKLKFFYSGVDHPEGWQIRGRENIQFTSREKEGASITYSTGEYMRFRFTPATVASGVPNISANWAGRERGFFGVQQFTDAALQDIIGGMESWEHVVGYLKRTHALLDEKMQAIAGGDYEKVLPPTEPSSTE